MDGTIVSEVNMMKKFICLYIVLNIICISAYCAPYDLAYLASPRYAFVSLIRSVAASMKGEETKVEETTPPVSTEKPKNRTLSDVAAAVAVVDSIIHSSYEGEDMMKMVYYVNEGAEQLECYFDSGSYSLGGSFTYENLTRGSLVYVGTDEKGIVDEYCVVAVYNKNTGRLSVDNNPTAIFRSQKIKFVSSYILDYRYKNGYYGVELVNGDSLSVPSDSYMYTIAPERSSVKIYNGGFTEADVYKAEYRDDMGQTVVYPVISVTYKDEAVFTCSYATPVYLNGDITQ